ncbi:hypothetical protein CRG98_007477 [Punica granatum]|uniref:Uncharacterized protein n=1 Tax=Punica granatum TaxID=22663 RepID=A0A2I0KUT2_PUNGR|nr:hypothetical protein CRG98_007477 [Punica granatum]
MPSSIHCRTFQPPNTHPSIPERSSGDSTESSDSQTLPRLFSRIPRQGNTWIVVEKNIPTRKRRRAHGFPSKGGNRMLSCSFRTRNDLFDQIQVRFPSFIVFSHVRECLLLEHARNDLKRDGKTSWNPIWAMGPLGFLQGEVAESHMDSYGLNEASSPRFRSVLEFRAIRNFNNITNIALKRLF